MDTDAPGFDNLQFLVYWHDFKRFKELSDQLFQKRQSRIMRNSDDDNAVGLMRRKTQYIGKIQIECYQAPLL